MTNIIVVCVEEIVKLAKKQSAAAIGFAETKVIM